MPPFFVSPVIPAYAGIHRTPACKRSMGPCLRRDDGGAEME